MTSQFAHMTSPSKFLRLFCFSCQDCQVQLLVQVSCEVNVIAGSGVRRYELGIPNLALMFLIQCY